MGDELKNFLNDLSGKEADDLIGSLEIKHLNVLMSLPKFDSNDGLSISEISFANTLGEKGYKIEDSTVVDLFQMGCLKWEIEGETFSVNQSLCGRENKNALVKRYVNLQRGGDGSDSFKRMFEGMNSCV